MNEPDDMSDTEKKAITREFIDRAIRAIRSSPDDLRAKGLAVAVHNDYRVDNRPHTFWLMTDDSDGAFFKGEGETDAEALDQIRKQVGAL
ncbi:MAG TPA: hypothetical protein VK797_22595 [Tepidisphaeraceae bacterium]|jgi:hypothetical protein|nr:hypothetical protein [Tepidisphaeraceae bacterium]